MPDDLSFWILYWVTAAGNQDFFFPTVMHTFIEQFRRGCEASSSVNKEGVFEQNEVKQSIIQ